LPPSRPQLEAVLSRAWMGRGILACALLPLSWLFWLISALRRRLYAAGWLNSTRLPVPVVVVGNIFVGGTGKTPLTIWLVQALRDAGWVPGVISRGYGAAASVAIPVTSASLPNQVGDEPLLIATHAHCPVMVGRKRVAAAQALLAAHPEVNVIISDDGLQHYALARDIEIILFDSRGTGNGWLLPAGPLREPASRARDFTVINSGKQVPGMPQNAVSMNLAATLAERLTNRSHAMPLAALAQPDDAGIKPTLAAAAGIGNPARFFGMLRQAGLDFLEMPLPDHYDFTDNPFASIVADIILITEKDAVKCRHIPALNNDPRLWVVPVTAQIDRALLDQLLEKLRGRSPA
jgi:tetraacyldisaccharide 4'-kinase